MVPNIAGKAITVKGPIDPDRLGTTIMHEHLFVAMLKSVALDENTPATDLALWNQKLMLENLHLAMASKPIAEYWALSDEAAAVTEAEQFRQLGGDTIVELTSVGMHRDALALRRLSHSTGLNVVMGSGWYKKLYHPGDMDRRTTEDMTNEIVRDITVGVGDTGIRSGIIGEVGIEGSPIDSNEEKSLRASAWASCATGAAISLHSGGMGREKLRVIRMLREEGVDPSRIIFGHSDQIAGDMPLMLELLEHGVYIQFDLMGRVNVPLVLQVQSDTWAAVADAPVAAVVTDAVSRLIDAGYACQILLSQDTAHKLQYKRYGGTGYSFILEKFLPHLRSQGVEEEFIHMMMVENPRRILTFSSPKF